MQRGCDYHHIIFIFTAKCTKPNEFFACGGACDNECDKLDSQNRTVCPIVNIKCNPKCYCEDGYARDYKNNCVPISECPGLLLQLASFNITTLTFVFASIRCINAVA